MPPVFQPHVHVVRIFACSRVVVKLFCLGVYVALAVLDTRLEFYKHIVLSGGSTMYPGLPSRMERELKQLYLERVLKGNTEQFQVSLKTRVTLTPRVVYIRVTAVVGHSRKGNLLSMFSLPFLEVHDSHRSAAASKAHGIPRWRRAGASHARCAKLLAHEEGLRGAGRSACAEEAEYEGMILSRLGGERGCEVCLAAVSSGGLFLCSYGSSCYALISAAVTALGAFSNAALFRMCVKLCPRMFLRSCEWSLRLRSSMRVSVA